MKVVLGFNGKLLDSIYDKFSNIINGDLNPEKDGYSVILNEQITIEDIKDITDNWLFVDIDLGSTSKYFLKTSEGEIDANEENFPIARATGVFSKIDGLNIEEQPNLFKAFCQEIFDSSNIMITLSYIHF